MMEDDSLAAVVPYRSLPKEGEADLRGNGVMIGYELRGPSPESSTLADVASASKTACRSLHAPRHGRHGPRGLSAPARARTS